MFKTAWQLLKSTFNSFLEDKAMRLAAAIGFYAIFSLGPVLVIIVVIAGFIWGEQAARGELVNQFSSVIGEGAAEQVQQLLAAAQQTGGGVIATVVGIVTLLIAATGVFSQLRDSLNTVWEVQPQPKQAIWGVVRDRLLSFAVVVAIAVLLIALLMATTVISALADRIEVELPIPVSLIQIAELLVSWAITTLLFAGIFKWLADVRIGWHDALAGGAVTAVLFSIGKFALGWYLGGGSATSVYGAAGSLIAIFFWIYYSSIIFLFGAEFTQVYARWRGHRITPGPNAVAISNEVRANEGLGRSKGVSKADQTSTQREDRPPAKRRRTHNGSDAGRSRVMRQNKTESPGEQLSRDVSKAVADFLIAVISARLTKARGHDDASDRTSKASSPPPRRAFTESRH